MSSLVTRVGVIGIVATCPVLSWGFGCVDPTSHAMRCYVVAITSMSYKLWPPSHSFVFIILAVCSKKVILKKALSEQKRGQLVPPRPLRGLALHHFLRYESKNGQNYSIFYPKAKRTKEKSSSSHIHLFTKCNA